MNLQLDIDFMVPRALSETEERSVVLVATRLSKLAGQRDTYTVTMQTETFEHIEGVIGDAMNELRGALPSLPPYTVRAVGVHVVRVGVNA